MAEDDEKEALQAEAAALGIEVDGRWGAARLKQEIATAQAQVTEAAPAADGVATAEPPAEASAPVQPETAEDPASPASDVLETAAPGRLVPTEGAPDFNDPSLDGQAIVEAALARQKVEG